MTMEKDALYWLFIILWVVFGLFTYWPSEPQNRIRSWGLVGYNIFILILFILIGLKIFGEPIK